MVPFRDVADIPGNLPVPAAFSHSTHISISTLYTKVRSDESRLRTYSSCPATRSIHAEHVEILVPSAARNLLITGLEISLILLMDWIIITRRPPSPSDEFSETKQHTSPLKAKLFLWASPNPVVF